MPLTFYSGSSGLYLDQLYIRYSDLGWPSPAGAFENYQAWGLGGRNDSGGLGTGDIVHRSSPTQIGSSTSWAQISTGWGGTTGGSAGTTLLVAGNNNPGNLYGIGYNGIGALGTGTAVSYSTPTQCTTINSYNVIFADVGATAFAITSNNDLWACGAGAGELGINTTGLASNYSAFQLVSSEYTGTAAAQSPGNFFVLVKNAKNYYSSSTVHSSGTLGIRADNTLWAWGNNSDGRLGIGTTTSTSSPTQVGALNNWSYAMIGVSAIALKTDQSLWTWGNNDAGQLGTNDIIQRSSPIQIGAQYNWTAVSAGGLNGAAVATNGTLWIWGSNSYGQLGNNSTATAAISSPIQVGSLTNWRVISLGQYAVKSIKTDGSLWSWGRNDYGQLAQGDIVHRSSPTQIGTSYGWKNLDNGGWDYTSHALNYTY